MKFLEIIEKNKKYKISKKKKYNILILNNITLYPLKEYLEYFLRKEKIYAEVEFGDYNNFIYNSNFYKKFDCVIFFWDFVNILEQNVPIFKRKKTIESKLFLNKIVKEINLSLENIGSDKLIIFNKLTELPFNYFHNLKKKFKSNLVNKVNQLIEKKENSNFYLLNLENILNNSSTENFSYAQFKINKSFYSIKFYEKYTLEILNIILPKTQKPKKNIILDCDNTLWNGIIGEPDKFNDQKNKKYFNMVNKILKNYKKNGILLSICSKNNYNDVRNYFQNKKNQHLNFDDFIIKKINWNPKHNNIIEISKELNLDLDSFIFIDDSEYEINLIKKYLPEIKTIMVPKNISEYPGIIKNLRKYFNDSVTKEDKFKTKMYLEEDLRKKSKSSYKSIIPYLKSLKLKMKFYVDYKDHIDRISQMTLKTNQFNLTTKRYSLKEIKKLYNDKKVLFFSINLIDSFGDYGVIGLAIIKLNKNNAEIDTFMMSCRVLGRNVDLAFFAEIYKYLKKIQIKKILASYKRTNKNIQVENFYDNLKFNILSQNKKNKSYYKEVSNENMKKISYIEVTYEK